MAVKQNANPLPRSPRRWVEDNGTPSQAFEQYMFNQWLNKFGPLTEAADDAAAKTAGVPLNGLYQTTAAGSSVVKIRSVP